jgi:hypothetical protein
MQQAHSLLRPRHPAAASLHQIPASAYNFPLPRKIIAMIDEARTNVMVSQHQQEFIESPL